MPLDHALYSNPDHVLTTWRTRAERLAALEALDLQVVADTDFSRYAAFAVTTDSPFVSAIIDPKRHRFAADDALWLSLVSPDGRIVGTQCIRRVVCDDYWRLLRTGELMGDRLPGFRWLPSPEVEADLPAMAGTIVHLTGLWIAPDWRRRVTPAGDRLVGAFVRFTHAFSLDLYRPDWSASLVDFKIAKPRLIHDLYAYPHAVPAFDCLLPGHAETMRSVLTWASAAELRDVPSRVLPRAA